MCVIRQLRVKALAKETSLCQNAVSPKQPCNKMSADVLPYVSNFIVVGTVSNRCLD